MSSLDAVLPKRNALQWKVLNFAGEKTDDFSSDTSSIRLYSGISTR